MRFASILVFIACFASSVKAAETPIANTWLDTFVRSNIASPEPWGTVQQVFTIKVGTAEVVLDSTPLDQLAESLGTQSYLWEEGGAFEWACLARDAETLWFYSASELSGGTVTGVGIDTRDAAPAVAGCGVWPADLAVDLGMMGVGMPADVIVANYLTSQPDDYGLFRSTTLTPDGTDPSYGIWQQLTFRANADGTVNAMAVMQQNGDW